MCFSSFCMASFMQLLILYGFSQRIGFCIKLVMVSCIYVVFFIQFLVCAAPSWFCMISCDKNIKFRIQRFLVFQQNFKESVQDFK